MGGNRRATPYLRVGFLDVDEFVLGNLRIPDAAEVNIGDCRFKNFQLSNIRNLGKFKLYKINDLPGEEQENGTFQVDNTSIGDAEFQSVDLTSFETLKIFDNILYGLKYTNTLLFRGKPKIEVGQFYDDDNEILKKRDTYRTLKNVTLNNNDSHAALIYHAEEMNYHWKTTSARNMDWWILGFNRITSNFGQNWFWPIAWILGAGSVCYVFLLLFLGMTIFNCDNWNEFFVFLNPTHETKFIGGCWGFWAYTIDLLFRALEGSLIYQAIQAFRRYSRNF